MALEADMMVALEGFVRMRSNYFLFLEEIETVGIQRKQPYFHIRNLGSKICDMEWEIDICSEHIVKR